MKQHHIIISILLLVSLFIIPFTNVHAQANLPIVRAVLFYSPTCGHCQYVITETLPPLLEKYDEQLQIVGLDITQPDGQMLFFAALEKNNVEYPGVPFLVIGNHYLVGSVDIPEKFPGLVEAYLAQGGVDWPDIPGLREALFQSQEADNPTAIAPTQPSEADNATAIAPTQTATLPTASTPAPIPTTFVFPIATPGLIPPDAHNTDWTDNFARDLAGNTLAVFVLAGMFASVVWAVALFRRTRDISLKDGWAWIIPILCVVGVGVAGYLTYVETAQVTAVCGPVGDCNTVQQSEYARLFGILPIGVLGLAGYVAIIIAWLIARYIHGCLADFASISMFVMTIFGTLFSIYLTFLEPFVIGATCAWCLASAVLMTILMLLSVRPAKAAYPKLVHPQSLHREYRQTGVHDD